jgi:hypothetical protein
MVSYRSAFGIGDGFLKSRSLQKIFYPHATPEALSFFYAADWEEEIARISPSENFACLTTRFLKYPAKRRVQASDPEDPHL